MGTVKHNKYDLNASIIIVNNCVVTTEANGQLSWEIMVDRDKYCYIERGTSEKLGPYW